MLLHSKPVLAEAPDFSEQQLEDLTRSVELKKQRLEDDIHDYIMRKQEELRSYERELIDQYRSMGGPSFIPGSHGAVSSDVNTPPNHAAATRQHRDSIMSSPEDDPKRTKHNRVHKREKELCGLVTPLYLPLLEAQAPPAKRRKEKKRLKEDKSGSSLLSSDQSSVSRDTKEVGESPSSESERKMARTESSSGYSTGEDAQENKSPAPGKKPRRAVAKKSSLRNSNTPKSRRKRVSIVIDDRVVLPADNITEISPSETAVSSSAASVADDVIDPRLIDPPIDPVQSGPVHHSLPHPITVSTRHTGHTLHETPPHLVYEPPKTDTRTFLDPSPPEANLSFPQHASDAPIYANKPEADLKEEELLVEGDVHFQAETSFDTYVGGLSGSGVDDVNQSGSYGYPSSLGASYLESYMQSRPLTVRMAAAERAGLQENEKRRLLQGDKEEDNQDRSDMDTDMRMADNGDDMDVVGEMDDFF